MDTLLIKKVDQPWKYDISLNGIDLPFVCDVQIIKNENDLPRCIIEIVIPDKDQFPEDCKIILEE